MSEREIKFPSPRDPMLLSDLDNTLVKDGFKYSPNEIQAAIEKAKVEGIKVGLSSDTPFEVLEVWRDRFGMNGPIIAEKGAVVGTEAGLIYNKDTSYAFLDSREAIAEEASQKGFVVWKGNPVEALRTDLHIGKVNDSILLINDLRRCSLGLFFRKSGQSGSLEVDSITTFRAIDIARKHYPRFEIDDDFNEEYGLVIVARKGTSKRSGTKILMGNENLHEVGMVGDSMSDYLGSDIAKHYAVNNASDSFKRLVVYIAKRELANGVAEILNEIVKAKE